MIRNLEIRHDGLAEALDFHVLAVILANRHRRVNDVRNDEHPLADFRLQFVFLRRQTLQIRKKFQDEKLVMVDEVVEMDKEYRAAIQQADTLRNQIKVASKQIGMLMGKGQKEEAEKAKEQVAVYKADLEVLRALSRSMPCRRSMIST